LASNSSAASAFERAAFRMLPIYGQSRRVSWITWGITLGYS
jgi:hypothetical protein